MKICVTGGVGFIGSHLVDRLVDNGNEVVVIDNLSRGKLQNIEKHIHNRSITFHEADIRTYDKLQKLMKDCEIIYHLAAQSNVMGAVVDLDYSFESNVIGTYNVLKAAKECGARRLIFTSSREAYGEALSIPVSEDHPLRSKNFYGASKVAGEKYCEIYQNMEFLEVVILRLANVYGQRDFNRVIPIFINNILKNENIRIFGGKQVIDFISIEKVVDALIQSLNNEKAIISATNIGSGKGTTLFELAKRIQGLFRSSNEIEVEPARSVEVVKYVADIKRMSEIFNISIVEDPLYYLSKMVEK
ncbi:MAG: SDR family NAD(P)-dependent oxidoreductase [Calditrichaceae bacterium]|jgi:UDP-glucose 4-epimerase